MRVVGGFHVLRITYTIMLLYISWTIFIRIEGYRSDKKKKN